MLSNSASFCNQNNTNNLNTHTINHNHSNGNQIVRNDEEHKLISAYCSRLADLYVKNPHLVATAAVQNQHASSASPSNSATPPPPPPANNNSNTLPNNQSNSIYSTVNQQKIRSSSKISLNELNTEQNNSNNSNNHYSNRSASLQRHLWSSSSGRNNSSFNYSTLNNSNYDTLGKKQTTKQLQIPSFLKQSDNLDNYATIRSISECNFKLNDAGPSQNKISSPSCTARNHRNQIDEKILKEKRDLVSKLERQNREIIKEIKRLRLKQQQQQQNLAFNTLHNEQLIHAQSLIQDSSPTTPNGGLKLNGATIIDPQLISQNEKRVNNNVIAELQTLKTRKGQLETRMHMLESSKDELLAQLQTLLKMNQQQQQQTNGKPKPDSRTSPRTLTLNSTQKYSSLINNAGITNKNLISSPTTNTPSVHNTGCTAFAPVMPSSSTNQHQSRSMSHTTGTSQHRSWSNPSNTSLFYELHTQDLNNPSSNKQMIAPVSSSLVPSSNTSLLSLNNAAGTLNASNSNLRNLRNDLLLAADSVTNAMQSLVKELHSENESYCDSSDEDENHKPPPPYHLKPQQLLLMQHSLSASNTPVVYRKNMGSNSLMNQNFIRNGMQFDDNYLSLSSSHNLLINIDNDTNALNQENRSVSKADLLKNLTKTFKDMNNNSEYDDVVSDLENELLNCERDEEVQGVKSNKTGDEHKILMDDSSPIVESDPLLLLNLQNLNQKSNNQKSNEGAGGENEQIALWRRELEQILVDDEEETSVTIKNQDEESSKKELREEVEEDMTSQKSEPVVVVKSVPATLKPDDSVFTFNEENQAKNNEETDEFSLL